MRIALAFSLLAACASTYRGMPDPTSEMHDLATACARLSNERGRVKGAEVAGEAVELHFRETRAKGEWLVVLLHGVLSDSRTRRCGRARSSRGGCRGSRPSGWSRCCATGRGDARHRR